MLTIVRAFILGLYERFTMGDAYGRTWSDNQDANESYDRGANLADRLRGWKDSQDTFTKSRL